MTGFVFSFFFVVFLQPVFIQWLKNRGIAGQPIREVGPQGHQSKKGTPTMGGAVVVAAVLLSAVLFADVKLLVVWVVVITLVSFGGIGFLDDWRKITQQTSAGLSERQKLIFQCLSALVVVVLLIATGHSTIVTFPFFKNLSFDLGVFFFAIFSMLVVVGASNALNLTDGLDGLAMGSVTSTAAAYSVFAYAAGHAKIAEYLGVHGVPGAGEIAIVLSSLVGGGLGFLWYNSYPAQVFMGDLGALAIGALIGICAVIVKHEVVLILAGGILVVEAVSVIMQRYYFKLTGKRFFKMAPIHHHFELMGWAEPKIIVRFWIVSILLALISLSSLKLR